MEDIEFKLFEKYYPSNEGFLLGKVDESNLYGYIFHGFALVNIDGEGTEGQVPVPVFHVPVFHGVPPVFHSTENNCQGGKIR